MGKTLFVLNDPPYGTERSYNGLRLAGSLTRRDDEQVRVFLMGDAASCASAGQVTPNGYYNIERMLKSVLRKGGQVKSCGGCSQARGIDQLKFIKGVQLSNMKEFARWTVEADKVLTF